MQYWCGERWWHEDRYHSALRGQPTLDQIDRAVERVAKLFDEKWFLSCQGHPAAFWLLAKGTGPLGFLYALGEDLLDMDDALRIQSVIHDLRQPDHFPGARFELGVAALLKRGGYAVEFRPSSPTRKHADILARRASEAVFIELKQLDETKFAAAAERLTMQLMLATSDLMSERFGSNDAPKCAIELSPEALGMLCGDPEADEIVTNAFANVIQEEVLRHSSGPFPVEFSIPRVATIRIGASQDQCSGIGHPMLPPEMELKRIIRGCLKDAIEQLQGLSPSLIVIKTGALLDKAIVTNVVTTWLCRPDIDLSNISAAMFLPAIPPAGDRIWLFPPFAVLNPEAHFPAANLQSFGCLRDAFGAYE